MRTPYSVFGLIGLNLVLAGLALYGGLMLLLDPSGTSLGLDSALPLIPYVQDFMPFSLWLIIVFAAFPAVLSYALLKDWKWAAIGSLTLGALEIVWIATQVVLLYELGFTYLWPLIAGFGVATIYLTIRHSVRNYLHWWTPKTGSGS